jgi:hypothetical protein
MAKKYEDMTKAEKEEVQLKNERARNPKEFDTKKKNTEIATQKVHTMPDGTKMKGAKHGMKHGGSVKGKCKMDGIAIRGKTRAKQRSK